MRSNSLGWLLHADQRTKQSIPGARDREGRKIVHVFPGNMPPKEEPQDRGKAMILMLMLETEEFVEWCS